MNIDYQSAFNLLVAVLSSMGGWLMSNIWKAVKDLQSDDKKLADKVASIEILVAGEYVKKDELMGFMGRVFQKLDAIDTKITENAVHATVIGEKVTALIKENDHKHR